MNAERMTPKVFQIGFNKTGTRSIFVLFKRSGYKSVHWGKGQLAEDIALSKKTGRRPLSDWADTVLFTDIEAVHTNAPPIEGYRSFEYLHYHYPEARFILNTRDVNAWLRSRMLHRNGKYFDYFVRHYETDNPIIIMERWKAGWVKHHDEVRRYFADKPGSLLEYKLGVDSGQKLKDFFAPELELNLAHWGNETRRIQRIRSQK